MRSKSGITLTAKGAEFIGYAKSVMEQYELLECGMYLEEIAKYKELISREKQSGQA